MVDDADDNADNAPATFSAEVDDDAAEWAVFAAFPSSTVSAIIPTVFDDGCRLSIRM